SHVGIDPAEIADALGVDRAHGFWSAVGAAWRHRDRLRGASTITQQVAKNLYLSSSRNPIRKVKEAVTALQLELTLSKDRILELYLNVAEWGPGIWGVDAASRAYFAVSASRLSEEQAAELAATLPHPRTSNPTFRPERTLARRGLILARYHGVDVYIPPDRLHRGGALGSLEGESYLVGGHVFQDLEQVHRVEADLERLAFVGDRELVLRFAQVRCLDRELHGTAGEREADPVRLIARDHAHAPQRRRHRGLVYRGDLVVLARDDLLVIRVRPFDQA